MSLADDYPELVVFASSSTASVSWTRLREEARRALQELVTARTATKGAK